MEKEKVWFLKKKIAHIGIVRELFFGNKIILGTAVLPVDRSLTQETEDVIFLFPVLKH